MDEALGLLVARCSDGDRGRRGYPTRRRTESGPDGMPHSTWPSTGKKGARTSSCLLRAFADGIQAPQGSGERGWEWTAGRELYRGVGRHGDR